MTTQERIVKPAMAPSVYLSLRNAVRPAIYAHFLLAEDQERAGQLAAECEDLLFLTRELLKAVGLAGILGAGPDGADAAVDEDGGDRQAQLLGAYAEAGLLWAKVVGSTMALARALLDRGDRDAVRRLAGFLAEAGEDGAATDLKIGLGKAVWATHRESLQDITNTMPPAAISDRHRGAAGRAARGPGGLSRTEPGGQPLPGAAGRVRARDHAGSGNRHTVRQPARAHRRGRGGEISGYRQAEPR